MFNILHRDEFLEQYHSMDVKFYGALLKRGTDISLLISQTEINKAKSVEDLMKQVAEKIADKQGRHNQNNTD
jgi:hypothetical protein